MDNLDDIARKYCAKILESSAARALPKEQAEALAIIAFTYGACWALNEPDMVTLGDAQLESLRQDKHQ